MKSISEIIGGCQILFGISFDIQEYFEDLLQADHKTFLHMLRVIEEFLPPIALNYVKRGRKPYEELPMIRSCLVKSFFRIDTVAGLRSRLVTDSCLRKICGFTSVPSEATFSRKYAKYAQDKLMEKTLEPLVTSYNEGYVIDNISRDSTAIEAREKATNKKKEVKPKRPRGRPPKEESPVKKEPTVLQKQLEQSDLKSIQELNKECSWGCKRNSQGNNNYWKGYKLHLDVTDNGMPISAIVTGANVHDSQVAIPLEQQTGQRITHQYSLMDSAYDAKEIHNFIISQGRIPIIDPNKRRKEKRIFTPEEKHRFKVRSTVERTNGHLKDWLIPSKIMVRGPDKVAHCLMTGVVCLAAIKILQYYILPKIQETA